MRMLGVHVTPMHLRVDLDVEEVQGLCRLGLEAQRRRTCPLMMALVTGAKP